MSDARIDQLIINSPYEEPKHHWLYVRESQTFVQRPGRRKSGYWRATTHARLGSDDQGEFVEIPLVNQIRPRVREWKRKGYPNVTNTTRRLLELWNNEDQREQKRLFWCQLEAIETAIWLTEASSSDKQGIEIPADNGEWVRECLKLATGTGKTVVMAMLIAWQVLNKIANPGDSRFSKHILIIAPGLTVRDRLQVLLPENVDNFYDDFDLIDSTMWQELQQAKIEVTNWHILAPYDENSGPKVVKKGPESDEAFVRRILPDFGGAKNILVINDEAHHCHRPTGIELAGEKEKATIWISGIDKINRARGVLKTYDLTATPFKPTGANNRGEQLFGWIVSDFGLNDAIESGLVKTPKVAVRDDSQLAGDMKSKLFHIYEHVKTDLNRRAPKTEGLPDLVDRAVNILGADWLKSRNEWDQHGRATPPVMIMITNRAETAARLEYSLVNGFFSGTELYDREKFIRIDQEALDKIEADKGEKFDKSKLDLVKAERDKFNTVGKEGKPGEQIQCVVGVNMLSEGWDAKTVTHILGLRAFTSQLLCEQVVGRGLRRISYDINSKTGLFEPEYVTVFGVPFTFLPVEGREGVPAPEKPKTKIEPLMDRKNLKIDWPHVLRVDYKLSYFLDVAWDELKKLEISSEDAPTTVEVAPTVDNKPNFDMLSEIKPDELIGEDRLQTAKLKAAVRLHEQFGKNWPGGTGNHIGQIVRIIDKFLESDKLSLKIPNSADPEKLKRIMIALNFQKITSYIGSFIRSSSKEEPVAIFDPVRPKRSTATAMTWYTSKPTQPVLKSQISHVVADSNWEGSVAFELERNRIAGLVSWVKNDHLGFEIFYLWKGQLHTYYPDYIIKFQNDRHLIVEVKGQTKEQDQAKWVAANEWVRAVNASKKFGTWEFKVLDAPKNIFEVIK